MKMLSTWEERERAVKTNMVFIDPTSVGWTGKKWIDVCREYGFKTSARKEKRIRLVTHYGAR
jgi:hypothetical protein